MIFKFVKVMRAKLGNWPTFILFIIGIILMVLMDNGLVARAYSYVWYAVLGLFLPIYYFSDLREWRFNDFVSMILISVCIIMWWEMCCAGMVTMLQGLFVLMALVTFVFLLAIAIFICIPKEPR